VCLKTAAYDTVKLVEPQIFDHDPYGKTTPRSSRNRLSHRAGWLSQEAIKMLGTNVWGFSTRNSAHPFEIHSFTNFLQMISIFAIPAG